MKLINHHWYLPYTKWTFIILFPISSIFKWISILRKNFFIKYKLKSKIFIINIGNITIGGTGKTPTVELISKYLKIKNFKPAIISRGYKNKSKKYPINIQKEQTTVIKCGDEPYMLKSILGKIPIIIDPIKTRAIKYIERNLKNINIIISDDGLQHYKLNKEIEITIIDGERGFGNKKYIPSGPLRETINRIYYSDSIIINNENIFSLKKHIFHHKTNKMELKIKSFVNLKNKKYITIKNFSKINKLKTLTTICGIGNPNKFFKSIKNLGIESKNIRFMDHHNFSKKNFENIKSKTIIMSHKDSVKCQKFSRKNWWYTKTEPYISKNFLIFLNKTLVNTNFS